MKPSLILVACAVALVLAINCGQNGTAPSGNTTGSLALFVRIAPQTPLAKAAITTETRWDSLIVKVTATDFATPLYFRLPLSASVSLFADTLASIPAGNNRQIELFTKNTLDSVVHRAPVQTTDLLAGETKTLTFRLDPICGSILIELMDVPTAVDSVHAEFRSTSGTVVRSVAVKRSAKVYLSLDYVPDNTTGKLTIVGLSATAETLYVSRIPLTYKVGQNTTLPATFASAPTSTGLNLAIVKPGTTVVAGAMQSGDTIGPEYGPLIITELLYSATDSDYVEFYNPKTTDTTFDTLIMEIDGVKKTMKQITVKAKSFFVVSRKDRSWLTGIDNVVLSSFDLTTTGNWITLRTKTGTVIDWVAFGIAKITGWPVMPTSTDPSIVLDSLSADPAYNNYGQHWQLAVSPIAGNAKLLGTPGAAGK